MIDEDIYTFHIDAYSPETIPMSRLAEYMLALAEIFGEKGSVHFQGLKSGSTQILSRVQREAAPKVRENLLVASTGKLNEMLRSDNAEAKLLRSDSNVLDFPGRRLPRPAKMGPFTQAVEKDGVLVRIGGKDKSAHAIIEDSEGCTWSFEVTRELARDLAGLLYDRPIRLIGTGRWFRDEDGNWQHRDLKALEFQILSGESLANVVGRIRQLPSDAWNLGDDPVGQLRALRDDNQGVH
jgi:hypothetical protein